MSYEPCHLCNADWGENNFMQALLHSRQLLHDAFLRSPSCTCRPWALLGGPGHTGPCVLIKLVDHRQLFLAWAGPSLRAPPRRKEVGPSGEDTPRGWVRGPTIGLGGQKQTGREVGAGPALRLLLTGSRLCSLEGGSPEDQSPGQTGGHQRPWCPLLQDWGHGAWPGQGCPWRRVSLRGLGLCPGLFHDQ